MRLGLAIGLTCAISLSSVSVAFAGVEFGAPDFSNFLSRPGAVSCDSDYANYFTACPTPDLPPKPVKAAEKSPAPAKAKVKAKKQP